MGSQDYVSILRCRPRHRHATLRVCTRRWRRRGAVFVWGWRNIPAIVKPTVPPHRLRKITSLTILAPVTSPNFAIIRRTLIQHVSPAAAPQKSKIPLYYTGIFQSYRHPRTINKQWSFEIKRMDFYISLYMGNDFKKFSQIPWI